MRSNFAMVPFASHRISVSMSGNTLVHIEGGMLGRDIFGGGYGDVAISNEDKDTEEVLGEKDSQNVATYANILGNTKVQIDGGTWIWNQNADINGNITTWLAAQGKSEKICNSITEFKQITEDILKAENINDLPEGKAKTAISRILTDKDTQEFFSFTNDNILSGSFKKNNNIYGGGNRACLVGTYTDTDKTMVKEGTGEAIVEINHSPLDNITDQNGEQLSMFDYTPCRGSAGLSVPRIVPPLSSLFSEQDMEPTPRWLRRKCMHSRVARLATTELWKLTEQPIAISPRRKTTRHTLQ